MKYDIIVFEPVVGLQHHLIDAILICKMLQHTGKKVALLNLFDNIDTESASGIPIIYLPFKITMPDVSFQTQKKGKLSNFIDYFSLLYKQHKYLTRVRKFIENKADMFYCGSYSYSMSSVFFKMNKPCYFWGLRSYYFRGCANGMAFYFSIHKWWLNHLFLRNPYMKLFVSNIFIKDEMIKLGFPANRMALREERVIYNVTNNPYNNLDEIFNFLVIGKLRRSKRVVETCEAFLDSNIKNAELRIIGSSSKDYEEEIQMICSNPLIVRNNMFLSYSDFMAYFQKSHFVIFGDEKNETTITNGTLLEALINFRPVIVPNYLPYLFYIEKYGVGILYDPNVEGSLKSAIEKAYALGANHFYDNIKEFQKTIMFETASKRLINDINDNLTDNINNN